MFRQAHSTVNADDVTMLLLSFQHRELKREDISVRDRYRTDQINCVRSDVETSSTFYFFISFFLLVPEAVVP